MQIRGVLLDIDGTVVDTRPAYREANAHALGSGLVSVEDAQMTRWMDEWVSLKDIIEELDLSEAVADVIRSMRRTRLVELLTEKKPWIPGAPELLTALKTADTPRAFVTGASRGHVNMLHEILRFHDYIKEAVTEEDVNGRGKPDPHGLQMAADRLRVRRRHCLYLGNELVDVRAAKRAGMLACLVDTGKRDQFAVAECDEYFATLQEFHDFLKKRRLLTT